MYNTLFFFCLFILIFIILLYEWINSNNIYLLFSIVIVFILFFIIYFIDLNFNNIISLNHWKNSLILMILFLFIIIVNLIKNINFDIYLLFFLVLIGSLVIISSDHLLIIYLGLELQTFSLFILISKNKNSVKSSEAGLKYFILGAISSGLYLLGLCLFFISNNSLNIKDLIILNNDTLTSIGFSLILLSFSFKLSLSPFHFWLPDIYEGSSWDVISILSTLPKISIISIFIQIIIKADLILFFCLLSIIIGTLGALNQTKLKRLLAYSSISHMGFLILGFNIINSVGYEISFIYLLIYMLTIISVFILIINTNLLKDYYIIELSGLHYINKILSFSWLIIFLSIAGIPPFSGFISKWFILWNIICFDYIFSSIILILFSIIGAIYYLRIVKTIYFQKQSSYINWTRILNKNNHNENKFNDNLNLIFLGLGIFFTLFLILNPDPLISLINLLIIYLY